MFGFSLQKLLFTGIAIWAVWQAFKWIGRMQDQRGDGTRNGGARRPAATARRAAPAGDPAADDMVVEDMVKCAVCGDYVSKGAATNCGRAGCPYPG